MIERHISTSIKDTIEHFPITLLTGPRQVGKSTLLYHQFLKLGYSYISLDDTLELAMAKSDPRTFLEMHPAPLIIDEAQKAKELFLELERVVNQSRLEKGNKESNGMYILSGSQKSKLLDEAEESLSGRVGILSMSNLSINEIIQRENKAFEVNPVELSKRIKNIKMNETDIFKYIVRGFFPVLYDDIEIKTSTFYSYYLTTYLEKDLREFLKVDDELKFINFLKLLAANTGQELIYNNYAKQVGVSANTIKLWIATLVKTEIIFLLEPYNENSIVKRVVKRPKLYFFDTGLAAYLCGIDSPETLQKSFLKGHFFETFVVNEIRKSFINAGISPNLYYYRDADQAEIDLVIIKDGTLSMLEIKTGQNFNVSSVKGFKKLENTKLLKGKNAIICNADKVSILSDGTYIVPVATI